MENHFVEEPDPNSIAGIFYKSWLRAPSFSVSPKLETRETFRNGWGIVTNAPIFKSEMIEFSRGIELEIRDEAQKDTMLHKYLWKNPIGDSPACHCKECKTLGHLFYLFGGNVNFYNQVDSREESNITFVVIENAHKNLSWSNNHPPTPCHLGIMYANRDINQNEELLVYYGDRYRVEEDKNPKKIPFLDSKRTMYPPHFKFYEKDGGQPDGSSIVNGYSAQDLRNFRKKSEASMNYGTIPPDLDLEKLLQGELNKVDIK